MEVGEASEERGIYVLYEFREMRVVRINGRKPPFWYHGLMLRMNWFNINAESTKFFTGVLETRSGEGRHYFGALGG